jgi:hypothetical protein
MQSSAAPRGLRRAQFGAPSGAAQLGGGGHVRLGNIGIDRPGAG